MNLKRTVGRIGWALFGAGYVVLAVAAVACTLVAVDVLQRASEAIDEWGKERTP